MADEKKDDGASTDNPAEKTPAEKPTDDKGKSGESGDATRTDQSANTQSSSDVSKGEQDKAKYSDKDVQNIVKERLRQHDEAAAKKAAAAKKEAEDKALVEKGEFQKLADERGKEIDRLKVEIGRIEVLETQLKDTETALKAQLDSLRKDLPKNIIELLDELNPIKQLHWLARNPQGKATDEKPAKEKPVETNGTPKRRADGSAASEAERTDDEMPKNLVRL
jgi:hypothetical protein